LAASELATKPLVNAFTDALQRAVLGRTYATIAAHATSAEREMWIAKATAAFDDSLAHWRAAKLAPPVEPQRARQIAAVQAALAALESPARPRPRS
jgi:antibiotic biosynthesis monooxygenase (ABM) superfamily enzyme